jgi:catechol 2,3-dioxygenase-like lactoylglutathione lyase family enzyme
MTAKLRYLAYLTEQPDALAAFYGKHLQFDEMMRSPTGDVSLTDGFTKLSLFQSRDDLGEAHMVTGPHHIGFEVESIEKIKARFRRVCPRGVIVPESGKHRGDVRIYDPECHPISLSEKAFGLESKAGAVSKLRYLAFGALDPEILAEFYVTVFGLRAIGAAVPGNAKVRPGRLVTDGSVVLAFYDYFAPAAGMKPRYGLTRCGFATPNATARADLADPDGTTVILAKPDTTGVDAWHG